MPSDCWIMGKCLDVRTWTLATTVWLFCALPLGVAEDLPRPAPSSFLDQGFSGLYNLDFAGAQKDFGAWEKIHPDDPVGPVSQAAGFLFSEFDRLGVLEAQFYENDNSFFARPKLTPDPEVHNQFLNAITRAENLAHARLAKDPTDRDALFALTLS